VRAFTKESLILVGKDFHNVKFLINDSARNEVPLVRFTGRVIKPIDLRIVNTKKPGNSLTERTFDVSTRSEENNDQDEKLFSKRLMLMKHADDLNIFRRKMKHKKFLDLLMEERERLASNVLNSDPEFDKSKFLQVNKNKLVLTNDYLDPDFIPITHTADIEYEDNFLPDAPSVHDLFDFNIEPVSDEYDDEMIEEYLYEEEDYQMQ
jgi:hypothetical protein